VVIFSTAGVRTSTVGWNAGDIPWLNILRWQSAAADVYRRTVTKCWDTVRWWQIDADRCRQWQTRAACDTECLCNTYWQLRQFSESRGNIQLQQFIMSPDNIGYLAGWWLSKVLCPTWRNLGHFGDGGMTTASARIIAAASPTVCAVLSSVWATTVDNSNVYVYYLKGIVSVCFGCPARTVGFSGTRLHLCMYNQPRWATLRCRPPPG